MKAFFSSPRFLIGLLLLYACFLTGKSIIQITDEDRNDFEVFYMAGEASLEKNAALYDLLSPVDGRPYIYPTGAALWLMPFSALPFNISAVIWSLLKTSAACFLFLAIAKNLKDHFGFAHIFLLILLSVIFTRQPVDSDFSNGQINIFVAAFGILGVLLMMKEEPPKWLAGAFLLALSVTIKLTPLVLLAVPFLFKKWKPFFATLGSIGLLMLLLPGAWFGWQANLKMTSEYSQRTSRLMKNPLDKDRQVSLSEMISFTQGQLMVPDDVYYDADEGRLMADINGEARIYRVRDRHPFNTDHARLIWVVASFLVGIAYLLVRWRLFRGIPFDWTWDLAVLCVLSILLSPLVRRAHLVILVYPIMWMVAFWFSQYMQHRSWKKLWNSQKLLAITSVIALAFLYMNEDVPVPIFTMPYFPMIFFSLIAMLVFFALVARQTPKIHDHLS